MVNAYQNFNDLPGRLQELTRSIIGCAYQVSNTLGIGFLEKVYENALAYELRKSGLQVCQQHPIQVMYDGVGVGDYYADLLVEQSVLVELKTVESLQNVHIAQCLNYLNATGFPICLLLNFSRPRVELRRVINTHYDIWRLTEGGGEEFNNR